jgi:hypothetical protein
MLEDVGDNVEAPVSFDLSHEDVTATWRMCVTGRRF